MDRNRIIMLVLVAIMALGLMGYLVKPPGLQPETRVRDIIAHAIIVLARSRSAGNLSIC